MRDADVSPIPPDDDRALGQDGELVDRALGANLLEHADEEVGEHDHDVGEVSPGAREGHEARKHEVDAIEERKGMLGRNLANRLGLGPRIGVRETVCQTLGHLFGREAAKLGRNDVFGVLVSQEGSNRCGARAGACECSLYGVRERPGHPKRVLTELKPTQTDQADFEVGAECRILSLASSLSSAG